MVAASLVTGKSYSLTEVRRALATASGIRVCGESLEGAKGRIFVDIGALLPAGYEGNIHFNPAQNGSTPYSEKFVFQRNPDCFIYIGSTPEY